MTYDVLDVKPMTRRIGAEIFGVDLSQPLSNRQFEEVHQA
ncbi:MAG: taurine dioxygenase, partial [Gemmatimonadaceae bacterium]|nr:taurine dioxygenase [Caulobacter sp.]